MSPSFTRISIEKIFNFNIYYSALRLQVTGNDKKRETIYWNEEWKTLSIRRLWRNIINLEDLLWFQFNFFPNFELFIGKLMEMTKKEEKYETNFNEMYPWSLHSGVFEMNCWSKIYWTLIDSDSRRQVFLNLDKNVCLIQRLCCRLYLHKFCIISRACGLMFVMICAEKNRTKILLFYIQLFLHNFEFITQRNFTVYCIGTLSKILFQDIKFLGTWMTESMKCWSFPGVFMCSLSLSNNVLFTTHRENFLIDTILFVFHSVV